ncbi:MAG TPA: antitoxin [Chloroflexota bacterium]|jgi:hypothetical protein|nr:antitoxin [Chloroflexota bacterium]
MPRTTVDIDAPVLREVRELQKQEGRSLGKVVSELLAEALTRRKQRRPAPRLEWISRPMGALVDLSDKDALYAALDRDQA